MNETKHTRSRLAALFGLILQLAAFAALLVIDQLTSSASAARLAWYLLGGVPLWFATLLVMRQKELAEFEAEDLDALRRERAASGASTELFEREAGTVGIQVAATRLEWMLRWLVPAFSLISAVFLAWAGFQWLRQPVDALTATSALPVSLAVACVVMLLLFLGSRYAAGLARVPEWQLLRGCGSYMLGNAVLCAAVVVGITAYLYANVTIVERLVALAIPYLMLLLAAETTFNFVIDVYRPREAGVEPRAAFDSRLLGLIGEPGGIASSIAETVNYQFGFEVSQTWFYQLLQRALLPLMAAGVMALWLLTCILIVGPDQHAVIERFGRQLNADDPLGPGLHWKYPWPIDVGVKINTGTLHQIVVGYQDYDASPQEPETPEERQRARVVLWTDEKHRNLRHFNFVIYPKDFELDEAAQALVRDEATNQSVPVNLVRMEVAVQFRIDPTRLAALTQVHTNPVRMLRNIAWSEVGQYNAAHDIDMLLGENRERYGQLLRNRIAKRVREQQLGLEIVYVGLYNVHPDASVAESYRSVINADQEKNAVIREALVLEKALLSSAAGDPQFARRFALAVDQMKAADLDMNRSGQKLESDSPAGLERSLRDLRPLFEAVVRADAELRLARLHRDEVELEFELDIGGDIGRRAEAGARMASAEAALTAAREARDAAVEKVAEQSPSVASETVALVVRHVQSQVALGHWLADLGAKLERLEGESAMILADAQAERWEIEMRTEANFNRYLNEREVFRRAPRVYKSMMLLETLAQGLQKARKFFLAFDPGDRKVTVRFVAEDEQDVGVLSMPTGPAQ